MSTRAASELSILNREEELVKRTDRELISRESHWYRIIGQMLRDKNLVPLSRQHQHALALCVRINRASLSTPAELKAWQSEIAQHFEQEISYHFAAEEAHLFPAARRFEELSALVDELLSEHAQLRNYFAQAGSGKLDGTALLSFAQKLSSHIRKEERLFFEGMQKRLDSEELLKIGGLVEGSLAAAPQTCIVPAETKLRKFGP
jgi:hemerythrin-like domain-containing protein